jgi:hypothetical protein
MIPVEEERPRAPLAGASRRWVRLLPWAVAFVLSVALLPTTIVVLTADYGLNGGVAAGLAVAQAAPLLLAVVRPLQAWYVVFTADVAGSLVLLTVDFQERLLWPFPPMEIVGYVGLCLALGLREPRRTLLLVWLATAGANPGLRRAARFQRQGPAAHHPRGRRAAARRGAAGVVRGAAQAGRAGDHQRG